MACATVRPAPEDNSQAAPDGPYIMHRDGKILVKNITQNSTGLEVKTTSFQQRKDVKFRCSPNGLDMSFDVTLADTLTNAPSYYQAPQKMLVLSDIEGNFKGFQLMLEGAGVIDKQFNWTYGDGHLVLLGDFFDRGLHVTECLWLAYKLDQDAKAAGGIVHFILGNHEILNLQGNTQYVRQKYLLNTALLKENYETLYGEDSELGQWLRTKNAIEKIGDYAFCHGGISPEVAQLNMSIEKINEVSRQYLGKKQHAIVSAQAQKLFDMKSGVFWYRNAAKNLMTVTEIKAILEGISAKRMVVGHTLQNEITAMYGGRVICIDLYHEENLRQGFMKTLLIENGACFILDSNGEKSSVFTTVYSKTE